ncbi:ANTAR domain-containing protein [Aeromicrobium sp.]|uniref:ANTAR domain-containing protein n=1 Tax=Aeromicrobium sp. TaxID=1871063 RepID=UPI00199FDF47|nr:ANTAR domain-containing protein [Aeromicrobium sp.]MBC7629900.1 ANTAR domain-containing protein [Aeromicrobium sp.]
MSACPLPLQPDPDILKSLRDEIAGLRIAMANRACIEQAKGILMARHQVDESTAFAILRRWSMASNVKVNGLATALIRLSVRGTLMTSTCDALDVVSRELRHMSSPRFRA